jgi:hypothetical protein
MAIDLGYNFIDQRQPKLLNIVNCRIYVRQKSIKVFPSPPFSFLDFRHPPFLNDSYGSENRIYYMIKYLCSFVDEHFLVVLIIILTFSQR